LKNLIDFAFDISLISGRVFSVCTTIAREAREREALAAARAANAHLSPIDYLLQVLRDRRLHQGVVLRGAARTFDISLISGRVFSSQVPV